MMKEEIKMFKFVLLYFCENLVNASSWIGSRYLLTELKNIENLNVEFRPYKYEDVKTALKRLANEDNVIIGLSILQHNLEISEKFLELLPKNKKNMYVILGNIEPSMNPEYFLKNFEKVDSIIIGEGEKTLKEVCERIVKNKSLKNCEGIAYRDRGKIIFNPNRNLIENLDAQNNILFNRSAPTATTIHYIMGARGCLGNCSFCVDNVIYKMQPGKKNRTRSIENIVDEIEWLIKFRECKIINLYDSTFCEGKNNGKERLENLYYQMKSRKLWVILEINLRAEQINLETIDILESLKEVGLTTIFIGIESGNEEDLRLYNKIATVEENIKAISLLRKKKINIRYGFINFNPFSTIEKLRKNVRFLKETNLIVKKEEIESRLQLYSGAPILKKVIGAGLLAQGKDEPIRDAYAYKYVDEKIEKVYNQFQKYSDCIDVKLGDREIFNFQLYEHQFGNDKNIEKARCVYQQYVEKYSTLCLSLFEKILDDKVEDENYFMNQILEECKILQEYESEYYKYNFLLVKRLYEVNSIIW